MAASTMISVGEGFNLNAFAQQLSDTYQQKGFNVQVAVMGNSVSIIFDKGTGGINMLLGLGLGITANCVVNNGTLVINYSNGDWTGKIIGLAIGWFLCLVPFITAIIGVFKQLGLPKQIGNDAMVIASNMTSSPSAAGGYYSAPTPSYPTTTPTPSYPTADTAGVADSSSGSWNCTCGKTGNVGAFCSQCGSPRPR